MSRFQAPRLSTVVSRRADHVSDDDLRDARLELRDGGVWTRISGHGDDVWVTARSEDVAPVLHSLVYDMRVLRLSHEVVAHEA